MFCSHGAGVVVNWNEVREHMHVDSGLRFDDGEEPEEEMPVYRPSTTYSDGVAQDKELQAIFERTYGPIKRRDFLPQEPVRKKHAELPERREVTLRDSGPEYLLMDGYNIIFAWDELKAVARTSLDAARQLLMDILSNYQGFRKCVVILVFDAYKVPRNTG